MLRGLIVAIAGLAFVTVANADPLPKGAVKMTAAEITPLYAGKSSIRWTDGTGYFTPDGAFYWVSKDKKAYAVGAWSASGNKFCWRAKTWEASDGKKGDNKKPGHCHTFYKDKKGTPWSHWSGDKPGVYSKGEVKAYRKGDGGVLAGVKKIQAAAKAAG